MANLMHSRSMKSTSVVGKRAILTGQKYVLFLKLNANFVFFFFFLQVVL